MELSKKIRFNVVAERELIERSIIEINGVSGCNFELVEYDDTEIAIGTVEATKWKFEYIFKFGMFLERFRSMPPERWRIPSQ